MRKYNCIPRCTFRTPFWGFDNLNLALKTRETCFLTRIISNFDNSIDFMLK